MRKKSDKESIALEKRLVARCLKGERRAWDEFIDRYKRLIYNTIIRTLDSVAYENKEEITADLFQEFFALLFRDNCAKLRSFSWKNGCSLVFWICVITKNLTFDYIRKAFSRKKTIASVEGFSEAEKIFKDTGVSFLDEIESEERIVLFEEALRQLSEEELGLIKFIYYLELPHECVASLLNKSVDAVYMQKKRVIEKLAKIIKAKGAT